MVLMVWVGMVSAVLLYQTPNRDFLEAGSVEDDIEQLEQVDSRIDEFIETSEVEIIEVSKDSERTSLDFFVEYRIDRDKARSEQINLLREMINNPNSNDLIKNQAQERLLDITNNIEKEMEIESLIRARGYKDGVAVIRKESADVIVASEGLSKSDVAKIGDIVAKNTGLEPEDITIIEKASQ